MRSDIRLIEDTAAAPVDPAKVGIGQFRTATDGMGHEIICRRTAGGSTTRTRSAMGAVVESQSIGLAGTVAGTCVVKDGTGRFILAGANAADVYFLQEVFFRGAQQYARAVRGIAASDGDARAGAAILAIDAPLETDATGRLIVSTIGGNNVVAVSLSIQTAVGGAIIVRPQTFTL